MERTLFQYNHFKLESANVIVHKSDKRSRQSLIKVDGNGSKIKSLGDETYCGHFYLDSGL